jgi:ribosomal protein L39E
MVHLVDLPIKEGTVSDVGQPLRHDRQNRSLTHWLCTDEGVLGILNTKRRHFRRKYTAGSRVRHWASWGWKILPWKNGIDGNKALAE